MKLSEILKTEQSSFQPELTVRTPTKPPKDFLPPKAVQREQKKQQETEQNVREKIEKEFDVKLTAVKSELEKSFQSRVEEETRKLKEREEAFKKEKEFLELKMKSVNQEKDVMNQFQSKLETHLMEQMELQRKKMEDHFKKELGVAQMALEAMQNAMTLKDKEIELLRKTGVMTSAAPPLPTSFESPVAKEMPKAEHEKPKPETIEKKLPPLPTLPELPPTTMIKEVSSDPNQPSKVPEIIYEENPEWQRQASEIKSQLLTVGNQIFDGMHAGEPLQMSGLEKILIKLVPLIEKRDAEFLTVALEPYGDANPFVSHAVNSTLLTLILAQEFELNPQEKKDLGFAAFFHDVGLLNIREDLNYPKQLTPQLQQEVLNHPMKGAELLQAYLSPAALEGVMQHHEVGSGKGYPKGLTNQEIHVFANIIHIADSFEALVHERPYRNKPFEVNEAMKQLIDSGRGGVYDRAVLKALMVRIGLYPVMTFVELNNKKIARVIRQNREFPLSPTIRIEFDETGTKLKQPMILDLSTTHFVHITGSLKKDITEVQKSHFAAAPEPEEVKTDMVELFRNVVLVGVILAVLGILVYAVIKI